MFPKPVQRYLITTLAPQIEPPMHRISRTITSLYRKTPLSKHHSGAKKRSATPFVTLSTVTLATVTLATVTLATALATLSAINNGYAADTTNSNQGLSPSGSGKFILEDSTVERALSDNIDDSNDNTRQIALKRGVFAPDGRGARANDGAAIDIERIDNLEPVSLTGSSEGLFKLASPPRFTSKIGDRYAAITPRNNIVFYTLDPYLQSFVTSMISSADANHVAIVALNPKTGAILALAGRSPQIANIEYHNEFPAASLFKVITAAAAVEEAGIRPDSMINFRGGNYTLNQFNYLPNPSKDRRSMSVAEALGRSCNPVFGVLGVKHLNGSIIERYARRFGFNRSLELEVPLANSTAYIPSEDIFELSRTAAGFGAVRISPVHAATVAAALANGGIMPKPYLIERITTLDGVTLEKSAPRMLQQVVRADTARTLLEMMESTTTIGTSRRAFMAAPGQSVLGSISVAGKTGTLTGSNPAGLHNWFIGTAPIDDPQIAVAVITVDASYRSKASLLARRTIQRAFNIPGWEQHTAHGMARPREVARSHKGRSVGSAGAVGSAARKRKHSGKKVARAAAAGSGKRSAGGKKGSKGGERGRRG